ncbi:MAG: hypothetical protein NWP91_03860, partial [Rickettsiaceae bacterium]|nr:hypothetical protein [Rickettsiaceae bacterium]MDP5083429.1 hypothetical protein [Rickettsiaceae bacterium]
MMKKLFISLVLIFAIMGGTVFASITLTNYKKIYQEFVQGMKIDPASIKEGEFAIKKFPAPYLVIDKIEQAGKVIVKDVEIRFSMMSLLTFSPKIASVKIGEARIYLDHDDVNFFSHDEFISELLAKDALSAQASIDKLIFVESDADVPLVIENFVFSSRDNNTSFTGTVDTVGDLDGSFITSGDDVIFKLNVNDQTYNLNIEESYKNNSLEKGSFSMETSGLAQKIVKLIPDLAELAGTINSEEKVKITLDIEPSNNHISLKNIVISSDSITGTGEMSLSKNNFDKNDIKLEFTKIDIDSWRNAKGDGSSTYSNKYTSNKRFDFSKNPMRLEVSFKDIKLGEDNSLSDVSIKAAIEDGKLYIQDCSGDIDKSGKFKINGIITQNSFRSLFNGKVVFNHKDLNDLAEYFSGPEVRTASAIPFAFSSDVKMSSVDLSLQNLLIKTNDTDIAGNLSTKFIGNSPRTNATIRFSVVDLDKGSFPALSQAFNYAMSLFDGMKEEGYLGKFIPIRKISSIANYDITFDRLLVGQKMYDNVNFNLETSPGRVSLEQLFIQNGDDWIDSSVALEAQGIKPVIY